MKQRVVLVCVLIGLGAMVGVIAIYFAFDAAAQEVTARDKVLLELAKLFAQLALIGVLGVVVKAVVDGYAVDKARREAQIEVRKAIWRDMRDVYAQVEMARDLIEGAKSAKTYGEQLRKIMGLRSRLGEVRHEITFSSDVFDEREQIGDHVHAMESYLDSLINGYGKRYKSLSTAQRAYENDMKKSGQSSIDMNAELDKLPVLRDFREAADERSGDHGGLYHAEFKMNYFNARRAIIPQLVNKA